ncbi:MULTISPECIES: hypothetical protein [Stenotrophomonas]|uniref:Mobilization protein n=1 Tax=Stenotrophomonas muris TaxID=2963283 RepID=A0ABU5MNM8_9GAMM|nr:MULTISPECIES: hypothetical protein [Gammaproteobacteria]MBH1489515.1 hypothetical protein [Stenotrophomonas maltophilia]MBN5040647.1 hypothetical protein [Stenotrophomonas maltophilia]MBN5070557.1 hypothetical protein [Stenotrophomonas maltophilia]MDZ7514357.1 hypothetical protein [Stenotrophomonas muris]
MTSTNHYRDQIQRATSRLAQLQARELLALQRQEAKEKETKRRNEARRKRQVAELVFFAGAQNLPDDEIVIALRSHKDRLEGRPLSGGH